MRSIWISDFLPIRDIEESGILSIQIQFSYMGETMQTIQILTNNTFSVQWKLRQCGSVTCSATSREGSINSGICRKGQLERIVLAQVEKNNPKRQIKTCNMTPKTKVVQRKIMLRACLLCRSRKIRCDMAQPRCKMCVNLNRECLYQNEAPRKRYHASILHLLQDLLSPSGNYQIVTADLDLHLLGSMILNVKFLS